MKKEISKIVMVIGFLVALVGLLIWAVSDIEIDISSIEELDVSLSEISMFLVPDIFNVCYIAMVLSVAFVFSKNDTVKNVGYGLSALVGLKGILSLVRLGDIEKEVLDNRLGMTFCFIGMITMMVAALLYFGSIYMDFFGLVQKNKVYEKESAVDVLAKYKELQKENVLTEEEFKNKKEKLLNETIASEVKNDDPVALKKWKKLLDQNVITEEEFTKVKSGLFQ